MPAPSVSHCAIMWTKLIRFVTLLAILTMEPAYHRPATPPLLAYAECSRVFVYNEAVVYRGQCG